MQEQFFTRLSDRTMVTSNLYLEADEISSDSLNTVREQYLQKLNGEVIRIYNAKNNPTFIGDDQQYWTTATIDDVRRKKKIQFKEGDRQIVGIYYKDNQGDFVILVSAIDYSTINRADTLWKIMAATFIIIFIGLLLCSRWIAKRILAPLEDFIDQVKHIKVNNLHSRVKETTNKDEILMLAQNFNNLMEHLEQSFVLQKSFVANASHELRTPITRMMVAAEITLSMDRDKEALENTLLSVLEDAEKLEKIIQSLLDLAQADLEYGTLNLEPVRIDELMWTLQNKWNNVKSSKLQIEIEKMPTDESWLIFPCSLTLLEIAIDNVIANAFKFSNDAQVVCILQFSQNEIKINVIDAGPGIAKSDLTEIFKPGITLPQNRVHEGTGMGLYMAKKIISLYHGDISVQSEHGLGSSFLITLKRF
jgi:signal transduction histidine kinase